MTRLQLFITFQHVRAKKTINYKAKNVHDFAWFANKKFLVTKSNAHQKNAEVDTWAFFTKDQSKLWKKAVDYVSRAVEFYSENVGHYPWPQATAVLGPLGAGGGMEYPMITIIAPTYNAKSLDNVITHEVGHNWFYGILASNERATPYLDEGINSYYEGRYMHQYYCSENKLIPDNQLNIDLSMDMLHNFSARYNLDQYPNQHSERFSIINYGLDVYMRSAKIFKYAEQYYGREKFDRLMQRYYALWSFKTPRTSGLEKCLFQPD